MKRLIAIIISILMILALSVCSQQEQELEDMASGHGDGYATIVWGDKTYVHTVQSQIVIVENKSEL